MLATLVAGSETRFVAEMNAEARALGMDHTIYSNPSRFDPSTVSTAADQGASLCRRCASRSSARSCRCPA